MYATFGIRIKLDKLISLVYTHMCTHSKTESDWLDIFSGRIYFGITTSLFGCSEPCCVFIYVKWLKRAGPNESAYLTCAVCAIMRVCGAGECKIQWERVLAIGSPRLGRDWKWKELEWRIFLSLSLRCIAHIEHNNNYACVRVPDKRVRCAVRLIALCLKCITNWRLRLYGLHTNWSSGKLTSPVCENRSETFCARPITNDPAYVGKL